MDYQFAAGFTAAILANFVTVSFIYSIVRMKRKEADPIACGLILMCAFIAVAGSFAFHESRKELATIRPASAHQQPLALR